MGWIRRRVQQDRGCGSLGRPSDLMTALVPSNEARDKEISRRDGGVRADRALVSPAAQVVSEDARAHEPLEPPLGGKEAGVRACNGMHWEAAMLSPSAPSFDGKRAGAEVGTGMRLGIPM